MVMHVCCRFIIVILFINDQLSRLLNLVPICFEFAQAEEQNEEHRDYVLPYSKVSSRQ
jgi:hypothetical protein